MGWSTARFEVRKQGIRQISLLQREVSRTATRSVPLQLLLGLAAPLLGDT